MNYQQEVLKTLSNGESYERFVDFDELQMAAQGFASAANHMEQLKKRIAYGKNNPFTPSIKPVPRQNDHILHAKLGIAGESGEVLDANTRDEVKNEVGDLLWYISLLLTEYDLTFEEVMEGNIEKLRKKYASGKFTQKEALNSTVR